MVATLVQAPRSDRARLAWTTGPLLFFYTMEAVAWFAGPHLPIVERRTLLNVAILLAPLGLTYALLNRRVMDIGFVLNRAAVFSSVSLVIVGVFVLVEWLLSDWTQRASHSTNVVVTGALALALGLSIRYVHARVERVVDRVLFRRRREDEEAIRSLAREAPYITEPGALLTATVDVLRAHAGAAAVHVLLHDGRTYGGVDENDPAIVALRARRDVVELHRVDSRIAGELAYPLIARGRLTGALVLGPKKSGESYAPDESQAIAHLALTVAAALDSLSITRDLAREDIVEEIRTMNETLANLPAAIVKALATEVR
jgi:GAF domain-containing protein